MPYGRKVTRRRHVAHRVHHKKSGKKRHRMGALVPKGGYITTLLAAAAGAIAGRWGVDKLGPLLPASWSSKVQGVVKAGSLVAASLAVGYFFGRSKWAGIAKGVGIGLFVEGAHQGAQTLGWVSGVGRVDPASIVFPQGAKVGDYYKLQNRGAVAGGTNFPRPSTVGTPHKRPAVTVMGGM